MPQWNVCDGFDARPAVVKLLLLGLGYLLAFIIAAGVVALRVALTGGADREASGGMHAFGDLLLFLFAFGTASLVPTAASLFLMRRSALFWTISVIFALLVAAACLLSVAAWFLRLHFPGAIGGYTVWEALAIPVFVASPFLLVSFGIAMRAARGLHRRMLGVAVAIEAVCTIYALAWLVSLLLFQRSV